MIGPSSHAIKEGLQPRPSGQGPQLPQLLLAAQRDAAPLRCTSEAFSGQV